VREISLLSERSIRVAAVEYGLIAALVAVVIIGVVTTPGTNLSSKFTAIANKLC
jgi:pilus assembly protein Flp/PilA